MIKLRLPLLLLLITLCALPPATPSRAQGGDASAPEVNEGAAKTDEERQRALSALSEAARRALDSGETLKAARLLTRAGNVKLRLQLPREAMESYREALALLERTPDAEASVDALDGLGAAHTHVGECDAAGDFLRRAVALAERSGYAAGKAQALLTLSECKHYGDPTSALGMAREALALSQSAGDKTGVAKAYAAIGSYHQALNNLAEATESHEAALGIWRELGVADQQAAALIDLGFIEFRKSAWQNVFKFLSEAQGLLDEKSEPYNMGRINAGLAEAFVESGLPGPGLEKFRQSMDIYRRTQDKRAMIAAAWAIGKTQYMLGKYPEALDELQRTLADAEAMGDKKVAALCHDFLGRTFLALNDDASALSHFERAQEMYEQLKHPLEAARVRAFKGQVYEQQGRVEEAEKAYRDALETFQALADQVNQSATLYALGSLELKRNNLDAAEDYLRRSIEATENMRRLSTSRDLTAAFSASVHGRYESYIECLMRKARAEPGRGFEARAFETSELARGRSLAELLRATETTLAPGLDPQLAAREKSLRLALRVREDDRVALLGGEYKKEELDALEAELSRLEAEYKQVNESIRASHPTYDQLARPSAWDLRRIQEEVVADDQTVLLEFSLGEARSYVWAITRDQLTFRELPARATINAAARAVYEALAKEPGEGTDDSLTRAAGELSRMVLSPVAESLGGRRVVVVADGALNYIPFQLLPSPNADGEPLIAVNEVVNAPSASILGQLRQETARRRAPSKTLAAFGDPVSASDYARDKGKSGGGSVVAATRTPEGEEARRAVRDIELQGDAFDPTRTGRLFYAGRELANLREVASAGKTFVAADYDATRERLRATDLTDFAILHFATHGFLDPARPEKSGLVLSTVDREGRPIEGFVQLQDIYNLRAPVDLVVLSACRTALGKEVRGEGLIGLTRGFMYAGASSVVSSLWKVDDEATAELMKRFYANVLRGGQTPAAALRDAQNSIRREPQWRSPYYWAAFTLQGEYRRPIAATRAGVATVEGKMLLAAGALLLVACVGAAWLYRRRRRSQGARV